MLVTFDLSIETYLHPVSEPSQNDFSLLCGKAGINIHTPIPINGNAPLPSEMPIARFLTRVMKDRNDSLVVHGAKAQASQTLHPEIILMASRLEGEYFAINAKLINEFNFRMVPVGGTLLFGSDAARDIPIRLMSFNLSGQTTQAGLRGIILDNLSHPLFFIKGRRI